MTRPTDSSDEWKVKLKRKVELFQYGALLLYTAGTGFVRYYISLKFSTKTANINVNKNSSGDEIANVNFYAMRPEATRIR